MTSSSTTTATRRTTKTKTTSSSSSIHSYFFHHHDNNNSHSTPLQIWIWYTIWGAIHELSHVITSYVLQILWMELDQQQQQDQQQYGQLSILQPDWSTITTWFDILLNRRIQFHLVPIDDNNDDCDYDHDDIYDNDNHHHDNIQRKTTTTMMMIQWIRHGGWIGSCLVVIILWIVLQWRWCRYNSRRCCSNNDHPWWNSIIFVTAVVTAMEAISTDLFQWNNNISSSSSLVTELWQSLLSLSSSSSDTTTSTDSSSLDTVVMYCGNFGIILLSSHWWLNNHAKPALDTLEQMAEVTMMRGAQSGGVVMYHPSSKQQRSTSTTSHTTDSNNIIAMKAVRSRVVNKKRTDLSKLIRSQVQHDLPSSLVRKNNNDNKRTTSTPATMFVGHTRFATSSLSTLDGTHPHRWTSPSYRRVYNIVTSSCTTSTSTTTNNNRSRSPPPRPSNVIVENYITHNGDFDFYTPILPNHSSDGHNNRQYNNQQPPGTAKSSSSSPHSSSKIRKTTRTYDLSTIQTWLSIVTETITPASVDSCAIAGMIDILRTQGCFGLSARYAVVLGIEESCDRIWNMSTSRNSGKRGDRGGGGGSGSRLRRGRSELSSSSSSFASITDRSTSTTFGRRGESDEFPSYRLYWESIIGSVFEEALAEMFDNTFNGNDKGPMSLQNLGGSKELRMELAKCACRKLQKLSPNDILPLKRLLFGHHFVTDETAPQTVNDIESIHDGSSLLEFCLVTINAFFDNDLFYSTKTFMKHAKGSFGISVTSTLDAHRQMCLAARGQPISIAFYPDKDLICFGSEQAAVKAGMTTPFDDRSQGPTRRETAGGNASSSSEWTRLDLDDLGGEIIVLDWGQDKYKTPPVSWPNRHLEQYKLMGGRLSAILHQESKSKKVDTKLHHRMTNLSINEFINPLVRPTDDPVLKDINDIPKACKNIQANWNQPRAWNSLNRLAAFTLSSCLRTRLDRHVKGTTPAMSVDILVTGCEVSLWLAEQFASDLQKSFPKLKVEAVSSNKLLGLYGQEIAIPSLGFSYSPQTRNLHDSIVIIVSHSGGTFAPLACSNLIQSATNNIFVVTSEWDTQIGKQLRQMDEVDGTSEKMMSQRVFSTDVGLRPAEPCSVSVAATHQLLTNLFQYISVVILSDPRYRRVTKAQITEQDIQILERCNQMNVDALTEIVGCNSSGYQLDRTTPLRAKLIEVGNLWSGHILEQARAYIMCFVYIFVTVTSGWPIVYAISANWTGDWFQYVARFLDSIIFFFLPQICIIILRLFQGRNLRHRMVQRTLLIGDIPWVHQCAEQFLSKCFAVSYSIAGLNVISGNPADHLVHRHTHRVVRGTLAIFGRPDGRLSALSTAEASVCLSVNQASSIQSRGGTCETVTIGSNPFQLDLSFTGIFLKRHRPMFLCERLLIENDADEEKKRPEDETIAQSPDSKHGFFSSIGSIFSRNIDQNGKSRRPSHTGMSIHQIMDCSVSVKIHRQRSAPALLGAYLNMNEQMNSTPISPHDQQEDEGSPSGELYTSLSIDKVISEAIRNRRRDENIHQLFNSLDNDNDGMLSEDEFVRAAKTLDPALTHMEAKVMFDQADCDHTGKVDYHQFVSFLYSSGVNEQQIKVPPPARDERGVIKVEATREKYFGETLRKINAGKLKSNDMDFVLARGQHLVQELYDTRIASLQRFVAMTVLFHHIAKQVERFFSRISCGWWSYRFDRTHSIMRVATTASPVPNTDVRQRIEHLRLWKKVLSSVQVIETAYLDYRQRKYDMQVEALSGELAATKQTLVLMQLHDSSEIGDEDVTITQ